MKQFGIPFQIQTEDKIIGGYLSLRQVAWLAIPVITLVREFVIDRSYINNLPDGGFDIVEWKVILKSLILILTIVLGIIMAFVTFSGIRADSYSWKMVKYLFRKKTLKYERE